MYVMNIIVHTLMVIDIVFMIACYKWRWLAAFQIYFVILTRLFICFIPTSASRGMHPFIHCVMSFVIFIAHYCGSIWNIYSLLALTCFEMSFGVYVRFNRPFGL